jgi:hypothetical protein
MAATIKEIREGLAANLAAVFQPDVTTSAYQLEQFMPPTIMVMGPDQVSYDRAMASGLDEITMLVQGFGGPMLQGAQNNLDEWVSRGPLSVKNAIETDRTLGGKVMDLQVASMSSYRFNKFADGTVLLGCEWSIRVFNRGA